MSHDAKAEPRKEQIPLETLSSALAALRGPQWVHFLLLPLASMDPAHWSALYTRNAILGVFIAALALSYAYGLNAIGDRFFDRDGQKNPLIGVTKLPFVVLVLVLLTGFLSLTLTGFLGISAQLAVLASLLASTLYSVGPKLKAFPVVGTLMNVGIFAPLMFFARDEHRALPPGFWLLLVLFAVLLVQNQLLHELTDLEEDQAASVRTTAAVLGERASHGGVVALGVLGVLFAVLLAPTKLAMGVAVLVSVIASAAVLPRRMRASHRRVFHRVLAFPGGALLAVALWFGGGASL